MRPRLSLAVGVILLLLTAAGTMSLVARSHPQVRVFRMLRAVPAFHLIRDTDVTPDLIDSSSDGDPTQAPEVVGHFTLRPLPKYAPVKITDIGPSVPAQLSNPRSTVVGVPLSSAQTMNGRIAAGDTVRLTAIDPPHQSMTTTVLAADRAASPTEDPFILVILVSAQDVAMIGPLSRGAVLVTMRLS
jgi:hypothetical protein